MGPSDDSKLDLIARLQQLPMHHRWLRWAVLAGSLAFSAASTYYFGAQVRQEAHSRFETVAIGVANGVEFPDPRLPGGRLSPARPVRPLHPSHPLRIWPF